MSLFVLDWETFYDSKAGYTLSKMTTEAYINDPRFYCFGFSIKKDGGKSVWVPGSKVVSALEKLELDKHVVISHNAPFDMPILNWKYGVKPKFIIDTLAMARGLLGTEERLSLAALGERYGIGKKGDAVLQMDGVRHPSRELECYLGEYACNDADMEWDLWLELKKHYPLVELKMIDITTRMFSEPSFALDAGPIDREIALAEERKSKLLASADCTLEDLRSDDKFAELLIALGVEPPKKLSVKKSAKAGHPVYAWAFAKSDVDFKHLGESDDELVRFAVEARLGLKSTIKESRSLRFKKIQERMGTMPIALDYGGAATLRYTASKSAATNMLNLPRAIGNDPDSGLIRKALVAPEGKTVLVADSSQIEARILVWQAGQTNVVEAFAQGRDVYSEMASVIFSRHVDRKKNPDDFVPGFIGKAVVLGCGYGLGHMKFASMIFTGMLGMKGIQFDEKMVEQLNTSISSYVKFLSGKKDLVAQLEENKPAKLTNREWIIHAACAFRIINMFRENNPMIVAYWKLGDRLLNSMLTGDGATHGIFLTRKDAVLMPSGMWMHFKELERDKEGQYSCIRRKDGRVQRIKQYGGKVVENLTQNLAGIVIREAMVKMNDTGMRPVLQVYDEIVVIGDEEKAEADLEKMLAIMSETPAWAHGLPLAAEGDFAKSYGEAK